MIDGSFLGFYLRYEMRYLEKTLLGENARDKGESGEHESVNANVGGEGVMQ